MRMSAFFRWLKRATPVLLAAAAFVGCESTPPEREPSPSAPDTGLPVLRPPQESFKPLPPPEARLVDLRRLRVGMTMEEVLEIFPGPEETRLSAQDTTVWRYRFAELYFRDGRLYNWFDLEQDY